MKWLYDNWSKSTIFLAFYTILLLFLYVKDQNFAVFLIWIQTPVYLLHEFEEYILPGGFTDFFNRKALGSDKGDFPLTKTVSFWINIPLIFIAFPLTAILADKIDISLGIWIVYFSICNAMTHIVIFFIFRYNPGFLVSLFVNIPVGIYTIYYFASHHIISTKAQIAGLILGVLVQVVMVVYGFMVLKPKIKKQN